MIVVRSSLNIFMHHTDWLDELGMYTVPKPLPGAAERHDIVTASSVGGPSLGQRLAATGASVLRFANPLPTNKVAARLTDGRKWLEYALVWGHTRLEFLGRLVGVDERWTMFSPSVGTKRTALRAVLTYADGSVVSVRSKAEPDDFTHFVRPFAQRRLQHDLDLTQLEDVRLNWCRYLARTRAHNTANAPLQAIALYEIRHALPPPGVDPQHHWQAENARQLPSTPTYVYDLIAERIDAVSPQTVPREEHDGSL